MVKRMIQKTRPMLKKNQDISGLSSSMPAIGTRILPTMGINQYALQAVGRFKKALEAYDMALKLDPASEGARYNKQNLEKILNQKHWMRKKK